MIIFFILIDFISASVPQLISYPEQEQQATYNILVSSLFAASHEKNADNIHSTCPTKWPDSGKPMFNVTLLTDVNVAMKKKESETLHMYPLDFNMTDIFDASMNKTLMNNHIKKLSEDFIMEKN